MQINQAYAEAILGPPGTGKTTEIARLAKNHKHKNTLQLLTFTRQAAKQLAEKCRLPPRQSSTIHAYAYREQTWHAGKPPQIATNNNPETTWNQWLTQHAPHLTHLTPTQQQQTETAVEHHRNTLTPIEQWTKIETEWWHQKQQWMHHTETTDFTQLIHNLHNYTPEFTHCIIDEAQDLTPLEMAIITKWTNQQIHVTLVGDDDQALYTFRGSDPKNNLGQIQNTRTLTQSWRCPTKIHTLATNHIQQAHWRINKTWQPRKDGNQGTIHTKPHGTWTIPQTLNAAQKAANHNQNILILTPTTHQTNKWHQQLQNNGWLHGLPGETRFTTTPQGITTPGHPHTHLHNWATGHHQGIWTPKQITWLQLLQKHALQPSYKQWTRQPVTTQQLTTHILTPQAAANYGTTQWLQTWALPSKQKQLTTPLHVINTQGIQTWIEQQPHIWPTTIHTSKGLQAHIVILDLTTSKREATQWANTQPDETRRRTYVALTRATEAIWILQGPPGKTLPIP